MRAKHSVTRHARRKKVLGMTSGYWGERGSRYRRAIETLRRALVYAYRDRKVKKREFRALWITRINAALEQRGTNYHVFMHQLKTNNVILTRDILAKIAAEYPAVFDQIFETVTGKKVVTVA